MFVIHQILHTLLSKHLDVIMYIVTINCVLVVVSVYVLPVAYFILAYGHSSGSTQVLNFPYALPYFLLHFLTVLDILCAVYGLI
jgi:hypothetical protein